MCESYNRQYKTDYRSIMPTNLYGPGDNFNLENSHVIPALIRRIHEAKEYKHPKVTLWGTGSALREFLHVDDMAAASYHLMNLSQETYLSKTSQMLSHFNAGSGIDFSIKELAKTISEIVGYDGSIEWDTSKPDGTPRKLMDSSLIRSTGWSPAYDLKKGIENTYGWFIKNIDLIRK